MVACVTRLASIGGGTGNMRQARNRACMDLMESEGFVVLSWTWFEILNLLGTAVLQPRMIRPLM